MYEYFHGKLIELTAHELIIDCGGVAYKCFVPIHLLSKSLEVGSMLRIHTTLIVRENVQALYGFLERTERNLFELLITISGIGPKTALSLIGHLNSSELHAAIESNHVSTLSKVPGIGKKTAERLIVELKGKLLAFVSESPFTPSQKIQDALAALLHLGYSQSAASQALKKVLNTLPDECDLSTLITAALKVNK